MSNDHWLARIELAEARANAAEQALREAQGAQRQQRQFSRGEAPDTRCLVSAVSPVTAFDRMQALRVADTDNRYGDAVQLLCEVLERAGYEDLTYSFELLLDDIAGERRSSPDLDLPVVRVATLTAEVTAVRAERDEARGLAGGITADRWRERAIAAEQRIAGMQAERDRYRGALTIIFLMDDVLIDITDGYDPIPRLRRLPPWRAVMLARAAEKCGLIERPVLDALIAEASAVGGAGAALGLDGEG